MAIDTEHKRRSVQSYAGSTTLPPADGAMALNDRQAVAWIYSGIAVGAPVAAADTRTRRHIIRTHARTFGSIM